jgi:hypothetical protein
MAEIPSGDYIHRSIDQLRSMNANDYKQFTGLRNNNIVTDYTIKQLNNNNNLIDNRNTQQSPGIIEQKHHYSVPSTPPTPLSISEAQMNEAKVRCKSKSDGKR